MRSRENAWLLRVIVAFTVAVAALAMSCASANALAQTRVFGTTTYGYDNLASQQNVNSGDPDQHSPGDPGRVGTSASQRVIGPAPGLLPADLVPGSAIVRSIYDNNSQMFGARRPTPRAPGNQQAWGRHR